MSSVILPDPSVGPRLSKPTGWLDFTDPDGLAVAVEQLPARTSIGGDSIGERTRVCLPSHVLVVAAPAIDVLLQLRAALEPNR